MYLIMQCPVRKSLAKPIYTLDKVSASNTSRNNLEAPKIRLAGTEANARACYVSLREKLIASKGLGLVYIWSL